MTSCSKAKERTILANSARFAQRCRELLVIEYERDPKILEMMSPSLRAEIVTSSGRRESPAKLLMMRLAPSSPKPSDRAVWSWINELLK